MRKIRKWWLLIGLLLVLGLMISREPGGEGLLSARPAAAQGSEGNCPAFVEAALRSLESNCGGLERDAACYGNNRVDSVFWQPREDLAFSAPADRLPLVDLQTISTTPLDVQQTLWGVAVMSLQANLPDTLPGQAVTFLLMGDTTLENAVTPEQAAAVQPVEPVPAITIFPANLRSRPTTAANIVTSVRPGTALRLVGRNEAGDWFEATLATGGNAWIFNELFSVEDDALLAALPITYGPHAAPRYGPMQAFYLNTGLSDPTCNEAPNALVVHSTELAEVTLRVNELEIHLGSTVLLTLAPVPGTDRVALVIVLIEGSLRTTIGDVLVNLTTPGQGIAILLNAEGLVDGYSHLIDLADLGLNVSPGDICRAAVLSGLFGPVLDDALCASLDRTLIFFVPPPWQPPPPTAEPTEEPVPGGWGGCGSCEYCGPYAQAECVRAPDGQCLWDPATCGYHAPPPEEPTGPGGSGSLSVVSSYCFKGSAGSAQLTYSATDGATITAHTVSSSNSAVVSIAGSSAGGTTVNISFNCGFSMGSTADVTVNVNDSSGRAVSKTFTVTVN